MGHTVYRADDNGSNVRKVHTYNSFDSKHLAKKLAKRLTALCQGQYWVENSH